MFVQIMQGKVKDADLLDKQMDAWSRDFKPHATGFLGSTSGIDDNGNFIAIARFESGSPPSRSASRPSSRARSSCPITRRSRADSRITRPSTTGSPRSHARSSASSSTSRCSTRRPCRPSN